MMAKAAAKAATTCFRTAEQCWQPQPEISRRSYIPGEILQGPFVCPSVCLPACQPASKPAVFFCWLDRMLGGRTSAKTDECQDGRCCCGLSRLTESEEQVEERDEEGAAAVAAGARRQ